MAWQGGIRPYEKAMYDGQVRLARTVTLGKTNKARRGSDGHTGKDKDDTARKGLQGW